jgi:hypothetical protein
MSNILRSLTTPESLPNPSQSSFISHRTPICLGKEKHSKVGFAEELVYQRLAKRDDHAVTPSNDENQSTVDGEDGSDEVEVEEDDESTTSDQEKWDEYAADGSCGFESVPVSEDGKDEDLLSGHSDKEREQEETEDSDATIYERDRITTSRREYSNRHRIKVQRIGKAGRSARGNLNQGPLSSNRPFKTTMAKAKQPTFRAF